MKNVLKQNLKWFPVFLFVLYGLSSCTLTIDTDFNTKPPKVSTLDTSAITNSSIQLWGEVTDTGNDEIDEVGFCYNTTGKPTLENGTKVICKYDSTQFMVQITGLKLGTIYYLAAYAKNDAGISYGSTLKLKTLNYTYGSFTDVRDNKTYKTITINKQVWMAENLAYLPELNYKYSVYQAYPNYYVYNYTGQDVQEAKNTDNYKKYGVLYNWHAAQNIAPKGWRIPTKQDWEILIKYICDQKGIEYATNDTWWSVGTELKAEKGWGDIENSNDFGFTLLPANYIYPPDKITSTEGYFTYLWTSTEGTYNTIYLAICQRQLTSLWLTKSSKNYCCSIRLIKE
jgi:uncharacterized protein (TIGR02145 family)